jgi:hypothetical protein
VLVGGLCVQRVHLRQCPLHEVDHRQNGGRRELAILHVRDVHLLRKENEVKGCPSSVKKESSNSCAGNFTPFTLYCYVPPFRNFYVQTLATNWEAIFV